MERFDLGAKTKMLAAVLYGKEDLKIEPVAIPQIGHGDVLIRVRAALTCGTDVKVFRRGYHARMIVPPALFGHELAGDIVALGSGVNGFGLGDRVVAANSAPCGVCLYCREGHENLCEDLLFNNGAYAEYLRVPARIVERNTYRIPDHLTYQDAALPAPISCSRDFAIPSLIGFGALVRSISWPLHVTTASRPSPARNVVAMKAPATIIKKFFFIQSSSHRSGVPGLAPYLTGAKSCK